MQGIIPEAQNGLPSTGVPTNSLTDYIIAGTAGTFQMANRLDRPAIGQTVTGGGVNGACWRPPEWVPPFLATNLQPGSRMDPGAVVFVMDWHFSFVLAGAAPGWANDTSGFFFLSFGAGVSITNSVPGGGAPTGGFGLFLNTVAGAPALEYVSWATGGGVLERITVGAGVVSSVALWNTVRFVIVGASSGRPAAATTQVNGVDIAADRDFDGVSIQVPTVAVANATGMVGGFATRGAVGDALFFLMDAKLGRQTPAGVAEQPE
jgi:hypothetical protein